MRVRARRDLVAVQRDLLRSRVDAEDVAGDQDLRPQAFRLVERAHRQIVAGDAIGEPEVVLDPRGGPGLPAGCLALHHQGAEPLGGAVDRRGQPGRAAAHDDGVVLGRARRGLEPQAVRHVPERWAGDESPVREAQGRPSLVGHPARPARGELRGLRGEPVEDHLVAGHEPPQVMAGKVPAVADDRDLRGGRLRGESLQSAEPLARQRADRESDLGCRRGDHVVLPGVEAQDSCGLGGAEVPETLPRGDGHLRRRWCPEAATRWSSPALHPLGDLDLPGDHREERPLLTLVHRVFAGRRWTSAAACASRSRSA